MKLIYGITAAEGKDKVEKEDKVITVIQQQQQQ